MNVTIRKIADDLQLAVSTVSKALRDSHEISTETKKRVLDYAAKLDYLPNPYASSLKGRVTSNIAVVLPEVADSFFSIAINGIESVAREKGYHVVVYLTHEDIEREQSILRDLRNGRVDGVLISIVGNNSKNTEHIQDLCARGVPLVFFDRVSAAVNAARVVTDDLESGYKATELLIKKGCRRISFLSMSDALDITNQRLLGYKKAHEDYGVSLKSNAVVHGTNDEAESLKLIRKLMQRENRPDGIVGSVEKVTMLAYSVCHELGIRIPQDVRIIGFSHLQIASLLNPPLTTITQPAFEMGKASATLLFKALGKKKIDLKNEKIVIPSTLVERGSTQ